MTEIVDLSDGITVCSSLEEKKERKEKKKKTVMIFNASLFSFENFSER